MHSNSTRIAALRGLMTALEHQIDFATQHILIAREHFAAGETNAAIGTLMSIGSALEQAAALHVAILAIHRQPEESSHA
jgi:hypothetical protein